MDIKIEKLSNELIDQIKAGEVVERPLSVIKELVENSIDAQSDWIQVELLDGGKQLMRISDNGIGIPKEQMPIALERHATSKLKSYEDLNTISSFGFRGEALPSIAAVSHFSIRSRPKHQETGHEITLQGGLKQSEKSLSMNTGTVIQIKHLFENVPVRLKFLKSTQTEFSHIQDFLTAMAFCYPHIAFELHHNGRKVFHYPKCSSLQERFQSIVEFDHTKYLNIDYKRGSFELKGFAIKPEYAQTNSEKFMVFINGRYVKDRIARNGVLQAYQGLVLKGTSVSAVIFIQVDPSWIDVNAHPAKTEVRFHDPLAIQELIFIGLQNSLKENIHKQVNQTPSSITPSSITPSIVKSPQTPPILTNQEFKQKQAKQTASPPPSAPSSFMPKPRFPHMAQLKQTPILVSEPLIQPAPPAQMSVFNEASYLGQFANCYMLLEVKKELWVIDQHAFHERILFEEFSKSYANHKITSQGTLVPLMVPSSKLISAHVNEHKADVNELGFDFEILNNGNIAIHGFPAILSIEKVQPIFDDIIARILALYGLDTPEFHPLLEKAKRISLDDNTHVQQNSSLSKESVFHLYHATMACHSAIRAGDPLNPELAQRLLGRAKDVDFYAHCPHGRPVIRKFSSSDVASWFLRT